MTRIEYDAEADAAYVYFTKEQPKEGCVVRTVPVPGILRGMVNIDVNRDDEIVGIEVVGAREAAPGLVEQAIPSGQSPSA